MAKKRKYPKQPKANASAAVWENYLKKCEIVSKWNKDNVINPKLKKDLIREKVQKMKLGLPTGRK